MRVCASITYIIYIIYILSTLPCISPRESMECGEMKTCGECLTTPTMYCNWCSTTTTCNNIEAECPSPPIEQKGAPSLPEAILSCPFTSNPIGCGGDALLSGSNRIPMGLYSDNYPGLRCIYTLQVPTSWKGVNVRVLRYELLNAHYLGLLGGPCAFNSSFIYNDSYSCTHNPGTIQVNYVNGDISTFHTDTYDIQRTYIQIEFRDNSKDNNDKANIVLIIIIPIGVLFILLILVIVLCNKRCKRRSDRVARDPPLPVSERAIANTNERQYVYIYIYIYI